MLIDKLGLAWRRRELGFGLLMPHLRHQKLKVGVCFFDRKKLQLIGVLRNRLWRWRPEGRKEGRDLGVPRRMLIMLYLVAWSEGFVGIRGK